MKKYIIYLTSYVLLVFMGCSMNYNEVPEQVNDNSGLINEMAEDATLTTINIHTYDIININDALGMFGIPEHISREITVENYSDKFPVELQEILVHYNDDIINEGDGDWQKYEADCKEIMQEDIGDTLYADIVEALYDFYGFSIRLQPTFQIIDVDEDGNNEYVVYSLEDIGTLFIIKCVDGKWVVIGGGGDDRSPAKILYYEDKYYLLLGNTLSYWNDDVEMPGLTYWENDVALGGDDCWHELVIQPITINYTPFEIYSYEFNDSINYLAGIDLNTLEANDVEIVNIQPGYLCNESKTHLFMVMDSWEQSYNGKQYIYVTAFISRENDVLGEDDKMLAILQQKDDGTWDIVKVYYMVANYNIQFYEK